MRHFTFFENGGPFPGTCISCGGTTELFDLNRELISGGSAMLCKRCAAELAEFIGYAPKVDYENNILALKTEIQNLNVQVGNIPIETENLIDSIRSSVADFVLSISSKPKPNGNKTVPNGGKSSPKPSGNGKDSHEYAQTRTKPALHERPDGVPAAVNSDGRASDSV